MIPGQLDALVLLEEPSPPALEQVREHRGVAAFVVYNSDLLGTVDCQRGTDGRALRWFAVCHWCECIPRQITHVGGQEMYGQALNGLHLHWYQRHAHNWPRIRRRLIASGAHIE